MLIFLLIIIAIGVLLCSEAGQELLGGIMTLLMVGAILALVGGVLLVILVLIKVL